MKHVGIDEKSFGEGQDYVSVMTELDQLRVLEVTPERTMESADPLWKALPARRRKKVKAVCMDMWQAYKSSTAQYAPPSLYLV